MAELHDPEDEPDCDAEFDFNYEKRDNLSDANIREMVFQVVRVSCPLAFAPTRLHA